MVEVTVGIRMKYFKVSKNELKNPNFNNALKSQQRTFLFQYVIFLIVNFHAVNSDTNTFPVSLLTSLWITNNDVIASFSNR